MLARASYGILALAPLWLVTVGVSVGIGFLPFVDAICFLTVESIAHLLYFVKY